MADSDPISDGTPRKRQKIDHDNNTAKAWDSDNDSGDNLNPDDFATVPTQPLPSSQKRLRLPTTQFHTNFEALNSSSLPRSSSPFPTQFTQTLGHVTQPTQPLPKKPSPPSSDVQVDRSSPIASDVPSQPAPRMPPPITKAPFAKAKPSLLASAIGPPGTLFRPPVNVQKKPVPIAIDSDEDDSPADLDSDQETQGLKSNIKPTNFQKGGRGLDSSPNRVHANRVTESPHASSGGTFSSLVAGYNYDHQKPKPKRADDMASAYGSTSRGPRPVQAPKQTAPSRAKPVSGAQYSTLDDIPDFKHRQTVQRILRVLPELSIDMCMDAVRRKRGNFEDAMEWLSDHVADEPPPKPITIPDSDDMDDLAPTPVKPAVRGVAQSSSQQSTSKAAEFKRPSAKQQVKAPTQSIAQKYGSTQAQPARKSSLQTASSIWNEHPSSSTLRKESQDEDDVVQPKRRLIQGRRPERSPTPPSSPVLPTTPVDKLQQPLKRLQKTRPTITVDSDGESDSGVGQDEEDMLDPQETARQQRLLKWLNECTVRDLSDLCTQPEDVVRIVLDQRPFNSLDEIRVITNATEKKSSKATRTKLTGEKIVDICSEMWQGYDAVDDLVEQCEKIAKPIQEALKGWGVGSGNGELQLMNLDEAHDSGIGTPSSSCAPDDVPAPRSSKTKPKGHFLGQPPSMSEDVTLKDYQLVGLNWLNLLWSKRLSCILADDMGLGKTCQVISFLAHLQELETDGVHLVIVPGSTLENWLREFQTFAPGLKVVPYYGSQTERPELQYQIEQDFDKIDVIVTTYDMTVKRDDNKFLRGLGPAVCVYDEAHALRNPKSDRYQQLMRIPADFKVLLTGTPLQNNLQELIAILAFIMPNLFLEKREELEYIFKHKASTKDANHAALLSAQRIERARSMMTPFILRRKKAQVLWLPTKHNRVEYCEMTGSQADYYADILGDAQRVFAEKANGKKATAKQTSNVLMSLRKAAIHPLLSRRLYTDAKLKKIQTALLKHDEFGGNPADKVWKFLTGEAAISLKGGDYGLHRFCAERDYLHRFALKKEEWMDSGKVQKFKKLVTAYAKNDDKCLVFSQFTTLMDILEAVLETLNIRYMRLDGSTKMDMRQDMIDEFTSNERVKVFMLSTKAGGAGINLACANKVVIFDSGFNPQDDIQAENRAHRVGQTRDVEVVRLVTKGTIEEQIHALGESKLALDERVAGEGATAAEDKAAEKAGQEAVERMLMEGMHKEVDKGSADGEDVKDTFKKSLQNAGLTVS